MKYAATLRVNGVRLPGRDRAARTLLRVLRDELGLTGTKEGCDDSECGACMVLLDGRPVNSCSYLALQADGREVTTVEGLASGRRTRTRCSSAFLEAGRRAVRLLHARDADLARRRSCAETPQPTEDEIRVALAGNLCRCTGYQKIVRAVRAPPRSWRPRRRRSKPESGTPGGEIRVADASEGGRELVVLAVRDTLDGADRELELVGVERVAEQGVLEPQLLAGVQVGEAAERRTVRDLKRPQRELFAELDTREHGGGHPHDGRLAEERAHVDEHPRGTQRPVVAPLWDRG